MSESKQSKKAKIEAPLVSSIIGYEPLKLWDGYQDSYVRAYGLEHFRMPFADVKTHIGIEVEVENCVASNQRVPNYLLDYGSIWSMKEDGSLRNNGLEFVSNPICGENIGVALHVIEQLLEQSYPKHQFTARTSVHVHMNVRHMQANHLYNLIILYLLLEPIFYYYSDTIKNFDRKTNNFCVPISESRHYLGLPALIAKFEAKDWHEAIRRVCTSWYKYTGFNLLPIKSFGTVEFRHLCGTKNKYELYNWIQMLFKLKKYAETHTSDQIKHIIYNLNTLSGYSSFVYSVFGNSIKQPSETLLQQFLEDSSANLKAIYNGLDNPNIFNETLDRAKESNFNHILKAGNFPEIIDYNALEAKVMKKKAAYEKALLEYKSGGKLDENFSESEMTYVKELTQLQKYIKASPLKMLNANLNGNTM